MSSVYVFSYFPFGFEGRIWDLIVSVPDHCLSFYLFNHEKMCIKSQDEVMRPLFTSKFWPKWVVCPTATSIKIMKNVHKISVKKLWPKNNVGHSDVYFTVQWFSFISWRLLWMNIKLLDNESVWCNHWPQSICRSQLPLFHGPVNLPHISKTIWWMNINLLDNDSGWCQLWPQNECR